MKKLIYFISIVCVLLMVEGCNTQRALSAYDSLRYSHLTVFHQIVYPPFMNQPSTLILTQGRTHTGFGICMYKSYSSNGATMGEWRLVDDTLYIYPAFPIHPTDSNMLKTTQLIQGVDTVTERYKIIGDGLYDITDLTEFYKALEKDLGVPIDKYEYKPNLVYPTFRMCCITKDKRKGY